MNNQMQTNEERFLMIDNEKLLLDKATIEKFLTGGNKITEQEAKFFFELCKHQNLNPFLKEAYIVKYGQQAASIITDYKVVQDRVVSDPDYDGMESGIIVQRGDSIEKLIGGVKLPTDIIIGGWAKIYRKNVKIPIETTVSLEEFAAKKKDGTYNSQWATKTAFMIEKVAKTHAFRSSFPKRLQGMYVDEEMQQMGNDNKKIIEMQQVNKIENNDNKKIIEMQQEIKTNLSNLSNLVNESITNLFKNYNIKGDEDLATLEKINIQIENDLISAESDNSINDQTQMNDEFNEEMFGEL